MSEEAVFAAVDWGTSSFRLWLMDANGSTLAERRSVEGLSATKRDAFARILEAHLTASGASAALPVVICGMAGSRQGWTEAGYLDLPARLDDIATNAVAAPGSARPVLILPGLAQRSAARADVMRGEETQLLGAAALSPARPDGTFCMPGTHSKWVRIDGGRVTSFSTFMTGEIFSLMKQKSILAHTLGDADADPAHPAFSEGVRTAYGAPERLTNLLFSVRAGGLLFADNPPTAVARLSGLLVGAEIAGARGLCAADDVCLVVAGKLRLVYEAAFAALGLATRTIDADEAVRSGLWLAAYTIGLIEKKAITDDP